MVATSAHSKAHRLLCWVQGWVVPSHIPAAWLAPKMPRVPPPAGHCPNQMKRSHDPPSPSAALTSTPSMIVSTLTCSASEAPISPYLRPMNLWVCGKRQMRCNSNALQPRLSILCRHWPNAWRELCREGLTWVRGSNPAHCVLCSSMHVTLGSSCLDIYIIKKFYMVDRWSAGSSVVTPWCTGNTPTYARTPAIVRYAHPPSPPHLTMVFDCTMSMSPSVYLGGWVMSAGTASSIARGTWQCSHHRSLQESGLGPRGQLVRGSTGGHTAAHTQHPHPDPTNTNATTSADGRASGGAGAGAAPRHGPTWGTGQTGSAPCPPSWPHTPRACHRIRPWRRTAPGGPPRRAPCTQHSMAQRGAARLRRWVHCGTVGRGSGTAMWAGLSRVVCRCMFHLAGSARHCCKVQ